MHKHFLLTVLLTIWRQHAADCRRLHLCVCLHCMASCWIALMICARTNAASSPVLQEHSLTSWLLQTASHRIARVQLTQPSSTRSLNH